MRVDGDTLHINGVGQLTGAPVEARDIRAGAAVVIAALSADGTSEITNLENIDRGYEGLVEKLRALGALVERVTPEAVREVV